MIYRVYQEESAILRENVPLVKLHCYNQIYPQLKLNGYGLMTSYKDMTPVIHLLIIKYILKQGEVHSFSNFKTYI